MFVSVGGRTIRRRSTHAILNCQVLVNTKSGLGLRNLVWLSDGYSDIGPNIISSLLNRLLDILDLFNKSLVFFINTL